MAAFPIKLPVGCKAGAILLSLSTISPVWVVKERTGEAGRVVAGSRFILGEDVETKKQDRSL